ncbi:MAG: sensor histidine kinase [Spirochaetales bacterium]|nr:sensor histidine kinase [Spirochaetales bacterium]
MPYTAQEQLKHRFVGSILKILAIVGFIAYIPSMYLSVVEQVWVIAIIDTLFYLYIVVIAFVKKIAVSVKMVSLTVLAYALGVFLLVFTGPFGAGIIYLFAFIFITAIFYKPLITLFTNILVIVTFIGFGLLNHLDLLHWHQGLESMLVIAVNFILVALILSHGISFLMNGLSSYIQKQTILQKKLNNEMKQKDAEKNRAEQALEVKTHLMSELHHRVKNNLQVISSLINLHLSKQTAKTDRLQGLKDRVKAISMVHWLLYRNDQVACIDLKNTLEHILDNLFMSLKAANINFTKEIEVGDMQIGVDKATLISLALNEIISNSAKHAFPGGRPGEVHVKATVNKGTLELLISDNGAGFDKSEWNNKKNFGLEILSTLLKQLKAKYHLDTKNGTRYNINILTE